MFDHSDRKLRHSYKSAKKAVVQEFPGSEVSTVVSFRVGVRTRGAPLFFCKSQIIWEKTFTEEPLSFDPALSHTERGAQLLCPKFPTWAETYLDMFPQWNWTKAELEC